MQLLALLRGHHHYATLSESKVCTQAGQGTGEISPDATAGAFSL